jgi:hypothetical protein
MQHRVTKNKWGLSLASSLLLATILLIMVFMVSGISLSNYNISNKNENNRVAFALAESAANLAVSQCQAKSDWGVSGDPSENIDLSLPAFPNGRGRVIFDSTTAQAAGMPYSVNNLFSSDSVTGYRGRIVPGESLHIVASGSYQGITKYVETVVNMPPYKYAIASTGPVNSTGGLLLASVDSPLTVAGGVDAIPEDLLKPAHVVSNSNETPALRLDGSKAEPSRVWGDAEAVGTVELSPFTTVRGAVKAQQTEQKIPQIEVTDFDPEGQNNVLRLTSPMEANGLKVEGPYRRDGNLEVFSGLNLDGGYLYVKGNLDIYGGVRGRGAIFATGNIKIHDISTFRADEQQAIVAGGDVRVEGYAKNASVFQGIVYTGGNFNAKHITLLGSLIANGKQSSVNLDQVNMVYNQQAVDFQWDRTWSPSGQHMYVFNGPDGLVTAAQPSNAPTPWTVITPHHQLNGAELCINVTMSKPMIELDPALGPETFWKKSGPNGEGPGFYYDESLVKTRIKIPKAIQPDLDLSHPVLDYVTVDSLADLSNPAVSPHIRVNGGVASLATPFNDSRTALLARLNLQQVVSDYNRRYQDSLPKWVQKGAFTFSPNRFITTSDKMRRLLWREYRDPNQTTP